MDKKHNQGGKGSQGNQGGKVGGYIPTSQSFEPGMDGYVQPGTSGASQKFVVTPEDYGYVPEGPVSGPQGVSKVPIQGITTVTPQQSGETLTGVKAPLNGVTPVGQETPKSNASPSGTTVVYQGGKASQGGNSIQPKTGYHATAQPQQQGRWWERIVGGNYIPYTPKPAAPPPTVSLAFGKKAEEQPSVKKVEKLAVSKAGWDHISDQKPNQDGILNFEEENLKLVLDGCGSHKKSHIGVGLFTDALSGYVGLTPENFEPTVDKIFLDLVSLLTTDIKMLENLSFTILACFEKPDEYVVLSCGDGFIIADNGHRLKLINLDERGDNSPDYYVANLVDSRLLSRNQSGVSFKKTVFSKKDYVNIGVATDGLRYLDELSAAERYQFLHNLAARNQAQVAATINKVQKFFRDDITILF